MDRSTSEPSKERTKAAKKAAKAALKEQKKRAKQSAGAGPLPSVESATGEAGRGGSSSLTPAERSAAAAERQVRLQRWRVAIAVLTLIVALSTMLITTKPWRSAEGDMPSGDAPAEAP